MSATMLSVPIGTIIDYAGPNAPAGYLECDGSAVPRADYPALFAALGGTSSPWGLPDSTHFNLPNLGGRVTIGKGSRNVGNTGGSETHTLTADEMPNHGHPLRIVGNEGSTSSNTMRMPTPSWSTKWQDLSTDTFNPIRRTGGVSSQHHAALRRRAKAHPRCVARGRVA